MGAENVRILRNKEFNLMDYLQLNMKITMGNIFVYTSPH